MIIPDNIYDIIIRSMPIPCVDLIVGDNQGKVLLIKRGNEPAKRQWWFPGGRVHFNETRQDAAFRILKVECGLDAEQFEELGTFDVILDVSSENRISHGITTLFYTCVNGAVLPVIDKQNLAYDKKAIADWQQEELHDFLKNSFIILKENRNWVSGKSTED